MIKSHGGQTYFNHDTKKIIEKGRHIPESPFNWTVNDICKQCNEGWLNQSVEIPSEKYLEALIMGQGILTTEEARRSIALWAAKTSAVRGLIDPLPRGIPPEHYRWLKEKLEPPPGTHIWVGKSQFYPSAVTRHLRLSSIHPYTMQKYPIHITMIVIGHMVLLTIGISDMIVSGELLEKLIQIDNAPMIKVWPEGEIYNTDTLPELPWEYFHELSSIDHRNPITAKVPG